MHGAYRALLRRCIVRAGRVPICDIFGNQKIESKLSEKGTNCMKKSLRKLLSLALAAAMCLGLAATAMAVDYDDVIGPGYDDVINPVSGTPVYDAYGNLYYYVPGMGYYYPPSGQYYDSIETGAGYDDVIAPGYDDVIVPTYTPYVSIRSGGGSYEYGNSFTIGVNTNASTSSLYWNYDSAYLTHDGNGRFTVRYKGSSDVTTRITVSTSGDSDSINVTLRGYRDPLSVSLSNTSLSMMQNETRTLTVNTSGGGTPYKYEWSSENNGVARVSGNGNSATVTAMNSGTTRIAVTIRDYYNETRTLHCEVKVQYNAKNASYNASASATVGSQLALSSVTSAIAGAWANQIGGSLDYNTVVTLGTVTSGYGSIVFSNGTTINSNIAMSSLQNALFNPKSAGTFTTSYALKNTLGDTLSGSITITINAAPATSAPTTTTTTTTTTPAVSTTPKELVGKAAGEYFSTDIVTTVNGTPIESINVGGRTLISAEDLSGHGFQVSWNGTNRTLAISKGGSNFGGSTVKAASGKVGSKLGDYFYTDIVTYLDGQVISAYNTGGRTFFCAEDMEAYGYSVVWNGSARTLTVTTR